MNSIFLFFFFFFFSGVVIFFSAAPLCIHSLFVFYFLGVFVYDINDTRMAVLVNDYTLFEQISVMTEQNENLLLCEHIYLHSVIMTIAT